MFIESQKMPFIGFKKCKITKKQALKELTDETNKWVDKAEKIFKMKFPPLTVKLGLEGMTAGLSTTYADPLKIVITYNYKLYKEDREIDGILFCGYIIPHELAHSINICLNLIFVKKDVDLSVWESVPFDAHGKEFDEVMHKLGVYGMPSCMSFEGNDKQSYKYACECRERSMVCRVKKWEVSKCKECKSKIKFIK